MARFVLELEFGVDDEKRLEVRPAHREYLRGLHDQGVLIAAGPFADDTGALLVYEVPDETALRAILDGDPYYQHKVMREVSVREWSVVFG